LEDKDEKRIAKWYNELSNSYDELYGQEQSLKHDIVFTNIGDQEYETLVDIGCGTGVLIRRAEKFCEHTVGIDISIKMLNQAKVRSSERTDLILASSSMLPIRGGTADCLVSISTARNNPDLPNSLKELRRICKQRCRLVVSLFHKPEDETPDLLSDNVTCSRVSKRETIYFVQWD
jgi:ubiquinone/menaquinone biosynthesis C-methylase UbiE